MKIIQFILCFCFLATFICSQNSIFAQDEKSENSLDTLSDSSIDPYNFEAQFDYQGSSYKYSVSEKGDDWYSLVIWRKNTLLEGEAKMMEVYSTHIMIEDEIDNTNNKNARVRIRYAEKQGYVWKPYEHDFMQVIFLFDTQKINYAPFGAKMIDRSKHSIIPNNKLVVDFDNQSFTLADAVKTSIEFFIMKYPKLFYM
ncbi:hypothetical protein V9L05_11640 [Bernardetia sp. Wsw4-3y2]|uniref:hypothetical protein n=1 Tax=Bernardetia sp. Wsw4-3y2 TaxID=3127471 RepID=UPI0030D0884C